MRFTVLASGSGGNASLLEIDGYALLIDVGLGPRQLAARLAEFKYTWRRISAVLLTHTHGDHCRDRTLAHMARHGIPLYCHRDHARHLKRGSRGFAELDAARLVRHYPEKNFYITSGLAAQPVAVQHDSGATFGFRFSGDATLFSHAWSMGYVADLGIWNDAIADAFADVDLLALEFNHDVGLERNSGRPWPLVRRVLGDHGHLSNDQAADLLAAILARSSAGRLRRLVQLHLSHQCNRADLASAAAQVTLDAHGASVDVHTAEQHCNSPFWRIGSREELFADSPVRACESAAEVS